MEYTIYNKNTGTIIKTVSCSPNQIEIQYDDSIEEHIEGTFDKVTQKIINEKAVSKDINDINIYKYNEIKDEYPIINKSLTDVELDTLIDEFFYGQVDVEEWKLNNYSVLRKKFYPDIFEYLDAKVKINSKDNIIKEEGNLQLKKYYDDCNLIKGKYKKTT